MSIILRFAVEADISDILDFWLHAAENTDRVDTAEAVRQLLARDSEAMLLAVEGATIVGSVIAGFDGWRCHLYRFAVSPDHRRKGIGRLLLDAAEERFRVLGGRRADAMVLNDNELGVSAWAGSGYRRETDCARWVKPL